MIELSILAHPADLAFFERVARHVLGQLERVQSIDRRVLVFDLSNSTAEDAGRLRAVGDRLLASEAVDEWIELDWSPEVVANTMSRWYGDATFPTRALHGRARYQYAQSFDIAQRPMVLHLDSDVLIHAGDFGWIERACDTFEADPTIVAIVPMGGAPKADRLVEWVIGSKVDRSRFGVGPQVTSGLTSRHLILHRERVSNVLLPLLDHSVDHHWEQAMATQMEQRGVRRYTEISTVEYCWHPHRHNARFVRWLPDLIAAAEAGKFPYRRTGRQWDIMTEGRGFWPWLVLLTRRRFWAWLTRRRLE